jgi:hypothetical protein
VLAFYAAACASQGTCESVAPAKPPPAKAPAKPSPAKAGGFPAKASPLALGGGVTVLRQRPVSAALGGPLPLLALLALLHDASRDAGSDSRPEAIRDESPARSRGQQERGNPERGDQEEGPPGIIGSLSASADAAATAAAAAAAAAASTLHSFAPSRSSTTSSTAAALSSTLALGTEARCTRLDAVASRAVGALTALLSSEPMVGASPWSGLDWSGVEWSGVE